MPPRRTSAAAAGRTRGTRTTRPTTASAVVPADVTAAQQPPVQIAFPSAAAPSPSPSSPAPISTVPTSRGRGRDRGHGRARGRPPVTSRRTSSRLAARPSASPPPAYSSGGSSTTRITLARLRAVTLTTVGPSSSNVSTAATMRRVTRSSTQKLAAPAHGTGAGIMLDPAQAAVKDGSTGKSSSTSGRGSGRSRGRGCGRGRSRSRGRGLGRDSERPLVIRDKEAGVLAMDIASSEDHSDGRGASAREYGRGRDCGRGRGRGRGRAAMAIGHDADTMDVVGPSSRGEPRKNSSSIYGRGATVARDDEAVAKVVNDSSLGNDTERKANSASECSKDGYNGSGESLCNSDHHRVRVRGRCQGRGRGRGRSHVAVPSEHEAVPAIIDDPGSGVDSGQMHDSTSESPKDDESGSPASGRGRGLGRGRGRGRERGQGVASASVATVTGEEITDVNEADPDKGSKTSSGQMKPKEKNEEVSGVKRANPNVSVRLTTSVNNDRVSASEDPPQKRRKVPVRKSSRLNSVQEPSGSNNNDTDGVSDTQSGATRRREKRRVNEKMKKILEDRIMDIFERTGRIDNVFLAGRETIQEAEVRVGDDDDDDDDEESEYILEEVEEDEAEDEEEDEDEEDEGEKGVDGEQISREPAAENQNRETGEDRDRDEEMQERRMFDTDEELELRTGGPKDRIAVWNAKKGFKMSGNNAPYRKNLKRYLHTHTYCEKYARQERDDTRAENWRMETETGKRVRLVNGRLHLRDKITGKIFGGNCCPIYKNVNAYLRKRPNLERYDMYKPIKRKGNQETEEEIIEVEENDEAGDLIYGTNPYDNILEVKISTEDELPMSNHEIRSKSLQNIFDEQENGDDNPDNNAMNDDEIQPA